jgi:hypothetical protein
MTKSRLEPGRELLPSVGKLNSPSGSIRSEAPQTWKISSWDSLLTCRAFFGPVEA